MDLKHWVVAAAALFYVVLPAHGANAQQSSEFLENLRASIVRTIGAQAGTVELSVTGDVFLVARVNSNMNAASHGARNNEATAIGPVVAGAIAGKAEFANIHTIRVQYVSRSGSASEARVIDAVDFRKDPSGKFQFHGT